MYFSERSNRSGGFQSCLSLQSCALPPVCPDGNRGDPQAPLTQHVQGQGMTASGLPVHPKGERSFSIVRCAVPLGSTMIRVHFPAFTSHCVYRFDYNAACRKGQPPTEILRIFSKRQNNAGAGRMADPRRGTLSFVTQKFFCFGAINNRRNIGSIPLCRHIGWVFYPSVQVVSGTRPPLISSPGMVPRGCYK